MKLSVPWVGLARPTARAVRARRRRAAATLVSPLTCTGVVRSASSRPRAPALLSLPGHDSPVGAERQAVAGASRYWRRRWSARSLGREWCAAASSRPELPRTSSPPRPRRCRRPERQAVVGAGRDGGDVASPLTWTGVVRWCVVPSPSWPDPLAPRPDGAVGCERQAVVAAGARRRTTSSARSPGTGRCRTRRPVTELPGVVRTPTPRPCRRCGAPGCGWRRRRRRRRRSAR